MRSLIRMIAAASVLVSAPAWADLIIGRESTGSISASLRIRKVVLIPAYSHSIYFQEGKVTGDKSEISESRPYCRLYLGRSASRSTFLSAGTRFRFSEMNASGLPDYIQFSTAGRRIQDPLLDCVRTGVLFPMTTLSAMQSELGDIAELNIELPAPAGSSTGRTEKNLESAEQAEADSQVSRIGAARPAL